jgi:hypothetical protein
MDYKRTMFFGMTFLVIAMLAQRFMHPTAAIGEGATDAMKGLLFGLSIGFNLLSVRKKCIEAKQRH